jgi:hypothetical protein
MPIDEENPARHDAGINSAMLLYDWFKHITTLSLVTLGGLLSILQAGDTNVRPGVLSVILILIALAGMIGFNGQGRILSSELNSQPLSKSLRWLRHLATWSYAIGVGIFLLLIVESVG